MSDLLIKGMEMPTMECAYKAIIIRYDGEVYAGELPCIGTAHGESIAHAVSIPSNGDLIDAQEEMRFMQSCDYDTYEDYKRAFDMLDNALTIIPASK